MIDAKEYERQLKEVGFEEVSIRTFERENVFPAFYKFLVEQEERVGMFVKPTVFMQLKGVVGLMKYLSERAGIDMILVSANKPKLM